MGSLDTRIAGRKTVRDWEIAKLKLKGSTGSEIWQEIFQNFLQTRLEKRYFAPIRALEQMKQHDGEGFAIVALHCTLIEFLGSIICGKTYKYQRRGDPPLNKNEYSDSGDMFIFFLENYEPFKTMFSNRGSAKDFYTSVRCGLLHEARTKNNWKIRVRQSAPTPINTDTKVVYRNKMQNAFDQFMNWYEESLTKDIELQKAFIRKFDSLCSE